MKLNPVSYMIWRGKRLLINQNVDHKRADYAYKCIKGIKGNIGSDEKKYHSAIKSSGVLIQTSGLLQTLSFYISKQGKDKENSDERIVEVSSSEVFKWNDFSHYELIAFHILNWIHYRDDNSSLLLNVNNDSLINMYHDLLNRSEEEILLKTTESKALILWLERFADSMLEKEE